jgi:hypothetical protein
MGTGIMTGEGEETEKGKVWTFHDSYEGPKGKMEFRNVLTRVGDDELRWEMYQGDATEPGMTIRYTRKK